MKGRCAFRPLSRRGVLGAAGSLAFLSGARAAFAALAPTPRQTAGPFYPRSLPPDSDNDLVRVAGHERQASGTVTHLRGRVLDAEGRPVAGARVEIWQCDSRGRYHHVEDRSAGPAPDPDFQGYGATVTAADGGYRFRTIRPVAYPGRAPHIHFIVTPGRGAPLTTQMYVAGEARNDHDPVLAAIRDPATRARVIVPLTPAPELEPGALAGTFDIVLGDAA
jgi:protocatechuate 3,4-dioxygenase beta subunit